MGDFITWSVIRQNLEHICIMSDHVHATSYKNGWQKETPIFFSSALPAILLELLQLKYIRKQQYIKSTLEK